MPVEPGAAAEGETTISYRSSVGVSRVPRSNYFNYFDLLDGEQYVEYWTEAINSNWVRAGGSVAPSYAKQQTTQTAFQTAFHTAFVMPLTAPVRDANGEYVSFVQQQVGFTPRTNSNRARVPSAIAKSFMTGCLVCDRCVHFQPARTMTQQTRAR